MRAALARHGGWILWLVIAIVPLAFASGYQLFQLSMVVVYALAILGFNLVTGYNGHISLGHGAFYAVGAYVTAMMMNLWNIPYWATLPVSAVVCAGFGFLIGLPALRLGGLYLALTTFALAVATPQVLKYKAFEDWTGGVQGIVIDKPDAPFGLPLNGDQWIYLFSLLVATVSFGGARRQPGARTHWARHGGDPRPSAGRRGDGRQSRAVQDAHLRGQRDVHRRCRLARCDRGAVRVARQLLRSSCR